MGKTLANPSRRSECFTRPWESLEHESGFRKEQEQTFRRGNIYMLACCCHTRKKKLKIIFLLILRTTQKLQETRSHFSEASFHSSQLESDSLFQFKDPLQLNILKELTVILMSLLNKLRILASSKLKIVQTSRSELPILFQY